MTHGKKPRKCHNSGTRTCPSSVFLNPKGIPRNRDERWVAASVFGADFNIRPYKGTFTDQGSRTPSFLLSQELLFTRKNFYSKMETKLDIKFRLKQRKSMSAQYGGYDFNTENVLITMKVNYNTMARMW